MGTSFKMNVVLLAFAGLGSGLLLESGSEVQIQLEQERQARMKLETKVSQLQTVVNKLDSLVSAECLVQCPSQQTVAFMAQLSKTLDNPANGHVVVWDDVITNQGSAYNNVHGIFKAPVNGTYSFNLVASVPPASTTSHSIHLLLKLNSQTVGYIFLDANTVYWLRRTTSVVLHMSQDDELWTEVAGVTGQHSLGGCCYHSHLSGFLVNAD